MESNGIERDDISYRYATSACDGGGQWEKNLELLCEMKGRHGIELNDLSFSAAVAECFSGREFGKAVKLLPYGQTRGYLPALGEGVRSGNWPSGICTDTPFLCCFRFLWADC